MPKPSNGSKSNTWRQDLLHYIARNPKRPHRPRLLARALGVSETDYPEFRALLRDMIATGDLRPGSGRAVHPGDRTNDLVGVFRSNRRGFGFVEIEGRPDLYISESDVGGAMEGDKVLVRVVPSRGRSPDSRGVVVRIVERAVIRWVGVLEQLGRTFLVQPIGKTGVPVVEIEDAGAQSARIGDMVMVEPIERTLGSPRVRGVIVERLGDPSETRVQILSVIRRFGLADAFADAALEEARAAALDFDATAPSDRVDLRDLPTFTIDPDDARDFDDAISIEKLDGGRVRLGVHIADVSHFVRPGGTIDEEAYRRGNSVYFPGYVVPMLPEVLSNGVCSLQPGMDRFTISVFLTYNDRGKVVDEQFARSVIRSHCRLTYEQASHVLEGGACEVDPEILWRLKSAERLAHRIRKRRLDDGMLVLAIPELQIILDDSDQVIDAGPADTSFSHTIIEMFMVEANEAVARLFKRFKTDHLRRIHPPPEDDEGAGLRQLQHILGRKLPRRMDRTAIREILDSVRGEPSEAAVHFVLLRSLAQASYASHDEGHFALASEDYCHFTSPIRRYPDLVVHRLLAESLRGGGGDGDSEVPGFARLESIGRHTSQTERRAQQAEREAKTILLLQLMKTKLGEEADAIVTGVASYGAFVQLRPWMADGLVRVADFGSDEWVFNERLRLFRGSRSGVTIALGMFLRVVIAVVDEPRLALNLAPVQDLARPTPAAARPRNGKRTAVKRRADGRRRR